MKNLRRNKVPFWYCAFDHKEELIDEDGNRTGDYAVFYAPPVRLTGNVSVAHGEVQDELFGRSISYDKVILLDDPNCPMQEDSVLFVDREPQFKTITGRNGETVQLPLFDYIVKRVARSFYSSAYAIERVTVT